MALVLVSLRCSTVVEADLSLFPDEPGLVDDEWATERFGSDDNPIN